jgi:NADH kinase
MGSIGFLLPFRVADYQQAIIDVMERRATVMERARMECVGIQSGELFRMHALNELNMHRGKVPHLLNVECSVDGSFLTHGIADGLVVATPTGSTAYNLSAGGPILHPSVPAFVLTPVCPRSLSFRSVLLPIESTLELKVSMESRSEGVDVSMDGQQVGALGRGGVVAVSQSPYPVPCINRIHGPSDWAQDIRHLLKWNQSFGKNLNELD